MSFRLRDPLPWLYRTLFDAVERRGGRMVMLLFGRVFSGCTPGFSEPYRIDRTGDLQNLLSAKIYLAALIHCLVLTSTLAALSGTFLPVPGLTIGFLEDKWNLFLYAFVCPAYVTLCVRLVLLAMERDEPAADAEASAPVATAGQARRLFLSVFLISVFSSVLITSYVNDALDLQVVKQPYWFVEEWDGFRRLNSAGLYYIVLNYSLLFVTFLGGAAFISVSIDGIYLSRGLLDSNAEIDFATYKRRLDRLVLAYYWGVLLVACYALNIIVWKHSPLAGTANIHLAGAMLTLLGLFFVAVPRRFIEHAWTSYCARKRQATETSDDDELPRVLSSDKALIIRSVQGICIFGWLPNFYGFSEYLDLYHWLELVFKPI